MVNWFKLVYGLFGPTRKESNVPKVKSSSELTVLIYIPILSVPILVMINVKRDCKCLGY